MNLIARKLTGERRPKALHVNRVGYLGGVERVILTLAEGLADEGYETVLACPPEGGLMQLARDAGIGTLATPINRMRISLDPTVLLRYPLKLRTGARFLHDYCSAFGIGLIHAHHPVGALYSYRACAQLGIPLVLHVHEIPPAKPLYALALRAALRHADHVVACSLEGRRLVGEVGGSPERVEIVHNGISRRFLQQASCAGLPEIGPGGPHIGVFGLLEPRKGQDVFLAAACRLLEKYPQATFWLVGGAPLKDKASYVEALRAVAVQRPLSGHVRFVGHQANVSAWMKAMDVVSLPSVAHESLPMALIEAMMLGRPVVASRIGGTPEIIKDGETGRLVPPGDPAALAAAVDALLQSDGAILGARAAIDARERFSNELFARRIAAVYARLLQPTERMAG